MVRCNNAYLVWIWGILVILFGVLLVGCRTANLETDPAPSEMIIRQTSQDTPVGKTLPPPTKLATQPHHPTSDEVATPEPVATEVHTEPEESNVSEAQARLLELGYSEVGWIDGMITPQTEAAIRHFQYWNRLEITGQFDDATLDALFDESPKSPIYPPPFPGIILEENSILDDDHALHARLAELGYLSPDAEDWQLNRFGVQTRQAVMSFQQTNQLKSTGKVDWVTWTMLFRPWALPVTGKADWSEPMAGYEYNSIMALGGAPTLLAHDGKKLWLHISGYSNYGDVLLAVDPDLDPLTSLSPVRMGGASMEMDGILGEMIFAEGRLWLLYPNQSGNGTPYMQTINTQTGLLEHSGKFLECPEGYCFPSSALGYDGSRLWLSVNDQAINLDIKSLKTRTAKSIGWLARGKMVSDGVCLWMAGEAGLVAFNPKGNTTCSGANESYALPNSAWTFDGSRIWAAGGDLLMALDTRNGELQESILAGNDIRALAFDGKYVWIADAAADQVLAMDGESGLLNEPLRVVAMPAGLWFDGNGLWVTGEANQNVQYIKNITDMYTTSDSAVKMVTDAPLNIPVLTRNLSITSPRLQGQDVLILQQRLFELGYTEVGELDGIFGPLTQAAVKRFQAEHGLVVDGIVGPLTWAKLFNL